MKNKIPEREDVINEYLHYFYNSNSKRIRAARDYLTSLGIKIEDLMIDLDYSSDIIKKLADELKSSDYKMTKAQLEDYVKKVIRKPEMANPVRAMKVMKRLKNGLGVPKGSIRQMMFGCATCPHYKRMSCPHGGKHPEGGCRKRYLMYDMYISTCRGPIIPQMEEHLGELRVKSLEIAEADANLIFKDKAGNTIIGKPSFEWFTVQKLILELEDKIQKAKYGTKIKVEKEITVKDITRQFYRTNSQDIDPNKIIDAEYEELKKGEHNADGTRGNASETSEGIHNE